VELACKTSIWRRDVLSSLSSNWRSPSGIERRVGIHEKERLAEVKMGGTSEPHTRTPHRSGTERARETPALRYFGAAPVTLAQYTEVARKQTIRKMSVTASRWTALRGGHLTRPAGTSGPRGQLRRSIFLYGPSGNGKTFIAERLAKVMSGKSLSPRPSAWTTGHPRVRPVNTHASILESRWTRPRPSSRTGGVRRRWVLCDRR